MTHVYRWRSQVKYAMWSRRGYRDDRQVASQRFAGVTLYKVLQGASWSSQIEEGTEGEREKPEDFVVGPLGSSPTRSQTFQLVIAGCRRLLSCRRCFASEPVHGSLSLSPSLFHGSWPLHLLSTRVPRRSFSSMPALCSSTLPFPLHDSLHRDAAVAADADVAVVARIARSSSTTTIISLYVRSFVLPSSSSSSAALLVAMITR